jgi:outer membrane immunogenic protein
MKRFALLLASVAIATPAMAADIIYNDPYAPAAPAMDPVSFETAAPQWTGAYVGGQAGAAFATDSGPFSSEGSSFVGSNDDSDAGFIGGAHVGYDHQINNIIVGAVADINYIKADSSSSFELENAAGGTDRFSTNSDIDYLGTVRGKVGVAADRIAVYATGGLAYASLDTETSGPGEFTGSPSESAPEGTYGVVYSQDNDEVGYAVGAGVDYLATDNISLGMEYLYHDLGSANTKVTYAGTGAAAGETRSVSSNTDLDFHTVWAKASYRFN